MNIQTNSTGFRDYQPLLEDALGAPDSPLHLYHYYHTDAAKKNPDFYLEENGHSIFRSREINSFWASQKLSAMKPQGVMLGITQFDQDTPDMLPFSNRLRLIPWRLIFGGPTDGSLDSSKGLFVVEEMFHKREKLSAIVHITLLWGRRKTITGLYPQQGLKEIDLENNSYLSLPLKAGGTRAMNCPRNDTSMYGKYLKIWIHVCHLGDISIPKHKSNELGHIRIREIPLVVNLTAHDFSNHNMSQIVRAGVEEESEDQSSNSDDDHSIAEKSGPGDKMNIEEDEDENLFAGQSHGAILVPSNANTFVQPNPKASLSKE